MTESEIITIVSYMLGSFALGFTVGFLTVAFKKMFDQI